MLIGLKEKRRQRKENKGKDEQRKGRRKGRTEERKERRKEERMGRKRGWEGEKKKIFIFLAPFFSWLDRRKCVNWFKREKNAKERD